MKLSDADIHRDLQAPFEALVPLLDLKKMSKKRLSVANKSVMADLLGEEPVPPLPSDLPPQALNLFYSIFHLYSSIGRFEIYKKMFKYYPWKGRITQSEHIQSAYYLFVHECYILEERLKNYLNASKCYAESNSIRIDLKSISSLIMKWHKWVFGGPLRARGRHVHEDEFVPREINRIGLLDIMILGTRMKKSKSTSVWEALRRLAIRDAKKTWIDNCESAEKSARQIVASAFSLTRPIWSHLAASSSR